MKVISIPTVEFPSICEYVIDDTGERLISLSENGFLCESQYYLQKIPNSLRDCYARESVVNMLKLAESKLPHRLRFKIYDAYRPIQVQQYLWDMYREKVEILYPDLSSEEIDAKTGFFVSKPSYDVKKPSLHNTGGAIDVTIVYDERYALNMGTLFDDFTKRAWTNHFEDDYSDGEVNPEVRDNRRLLYTVMIEAGFTNLPSEWWHYDYGTKFWSYFKQKPALYNGILTYNE